MENKASLLLELAITKEQVNKIVHKRWKKVIVRWLLGIPLYYYFWGVTWMRYLFWIGVGMEIAVSFFVIIFHFKMKAKIQNIESQLEHIEQVI